MYERDLPVDFSFSGNSIAIDTETMGLNNQRDRLCLVQISSGDGKAHLIQLGGEFGYDAPNLKSLLADNKIIKIFHFARFDMAVIKKYLEVVCMPTYCTKIASKIARTYTDRHGLKELCKELLNVEISKQQQSSDWGSKILSENQLQYAASDVLYLHKIKDKLDLILERENRSELAYEAFKYLPSRTELDLRGWINTDIFSH